MKSEEDILAEVKRIEILSRRAVRDLLLGQYRSAFKGRGVLFDEVREYQPGDEVRFIDWNVTARMNAPYVKQFTEEREMSVLIGVDVSGSMQFGSAGKSKRTVATGIAAMLGFSAIANQDKVGLFLFDGAVEGHVPLKKGRKHCLRIVRDLIAPPPVSKKGDGTAAALEHLHHAHLQRSVVIIISDFIELQQSPETYHSALQQAHNRHDLCLIQVVDPREKELPENGIVILQDAESGETREVDCGDAKSRTDFKKSRSEKQEAMEFSLRTTGVDHVTVETTDEASLTLSQFFKKRSMIRHAPLIVVFLGLLFSLFTGELHAAESNPLLEEIEKELADIPLEELELEPAIPLDDEDASGPLKWLAWASVLAPAIFCVYLAMHRYVSPRLIAPSERNTDPYSSAIASLNALAHESDLTPFERMENLATILREFLHEAFSISSDTKALAELSDLLKQHDRITDPADWSRLLLGIDNLRFKSPPSSNPEMIDQAIALINESREVGQKA